MAPLCNTVKINNRLDAVQDLMSYQYELDMVRQKLGKLPDIERLLAKIYAYSIRHKVQAIYFEDVSLVKMKEFRQVLRALRSIPEIMKPIINRKRDMKSARLRNLLSEDCD